MADLSTDEQTVLLIAAKGERLIPIGRWKEPIDSLFAKGFLVRERHPGDPTGYFNNVISPSGRAAVDALDSEFDKVLTDMASPRQMAGMVVEAQKHTRDRFRATAEHIAAQMVELARESLESNGDDPLEIVLQRWTRTIVARAREMVK